MYYEAIFRGLSEKGIRFVEVMTAQGYRPRVPVDPLKLADAETVPGWRRETNLKALTFVHQALPFQQVDVMVETPVPFEGLWERSRRLPLADPIIPIASLTDLREMKRAAGREQDLADIEMLERVEKMRGEAGSPDSDG